MEPGVQARQRLAAMALLLLVPVPSLGTAAAMFWWPESMLGKALFGAAKFWLLLFPIFWMRLVDHEPFSASPARRGGLGVGAILGLAIAVAVVAVYVLARHLGAIDASTVAARAAKTGLNRPEMYLAGAVYWITINSLLEEYVWRWFVFRKCEVLWGGRGGVAASALGFTAHHVIALAAQVDGLLVLLGSVGVFVGGAVWSWLYERYRSVWPGYVSHAMVDVPIFVIGYGLIFGLR